MSEQAPMISVDAHLQRVLSTVGPLRPLDMSLQDAHGCVLAEDVVATTSMPPFDNSSMDGYAVHAADVASATTASPVALHVVADIAAGSGFATTVPPGMAARIMTGAPMPAGADAVVPVEWTDGGVAHVTVYQGAPPGAYVRRAGEDVLAGHPLLPAGTFLGAPQVGVLAAAGRRMVRVHPKPRVVVVSTGNELVEPGTDLRPGQIPDSNSYALAAAIREAGGIAYRVGIVGDEPKLLRDTLEDHLIQADIVVTSGGVSVGAYDVVKEVLGRLGTMRFDRVAMQPGMPQGFGTIGPDATPLFALPGNPVSALVSFEVFVRPALRRMLGAEPLERPRVNATLTHPLTSPAGKRQYARVRVERGGDRWLATPVGGPGSHPLAALASANGLAIVPEHETALAAGAQVVVMLLERRSR